jgi:uncharacterized UPF0146 family protein
MSAKTVYSIRVPSELRKMMEEMGEINWQEEINHFLEEFVKNKNKKKLLARAKAHRRIMKSGKSGADMIREDRDARAKAE